MSGLVNKSTKITLEMAKARHLCSEWSPERTAAFLGEGKTLVEVLQDAMKNDGITPLDAISGVARFLPNSIKQAFGIWCAKQCETLASYHGECFGLYLNAMERYFAREITRAEAEAFCRNYLSVELAGCVFGSTIKFFMFWYGACVADADMRGIEKAAAQNKPILHLIEMIEGAEEMTPPSGPDIAEDILQE